MQNNISQKMNQTPVIRIKLASKQIKSNENSPKLVDQSVAVAVEKCAKPENAFQLMMNSSAAICSNKPRKSSPTKFKRSHSDSTNSEVSDFSPTPPASIVTDHINISTGITPNNNVSRGRKRKQIQPDIVEYEEDVENTSILSNSILVEAKSLKWCLRSRKPKNYSHLDETSDLFCDVESTSRKKSGAKERKVASIFLKALPKPKEDPLITEARRKFLESGIPECVRRDSTKARIDSNTEDTIEFSHPIISHVQQMTVDDTLWHLEQIPLHDMCSYSVRREVEQPADMHYDESIMWRNRDRQCAIGFAPGNGKDNNPGPLLPLGKQDCRIMLKELKQSYEHFPVIKMVKRAQQMRKRSANDRILWTETYRPLTSEHIVGHRTAVAELKEWLQMWKTRADGANSSSASSYDSDFEYDDVLNRKRRTARTDEIIRVLIGPTGSGKTSAIYAVANELDFHVIEINASSKRTGRKLLQETHEATQSHQLQKERQEDGAPKSLCLILIEDIDLIFDEDDGFLTALNQLIMSSKRPIILTTSNTSSAISLKYIDAYNAIQLRHSSQHICAKLWLNIISLCEYKQPLNVFGITNYIDLRQSLLQLQLGVPLSRAKTTQSSCYSDLMEDGSISDKCHLKDYTSFCSVLDQNYNAYDSNTLDISNWILDHCGRPSTIFSGDSIDLKVLDAPAEISKLCNLSLDRTAKYLDYYPCIRAALRSQQADPESNVMRSQTSRRRSRRYDSLLEDLLTNGESKQFSKFSNALRCHTPVS